MNKVSLMSTLALMSSISFADIDASKNKNSEMKATTEANITSSKQIINGDSRSHRDAKKFALTASIFGYGYNTETQGLEAAYYLDKNNLVSLQFLDLVGYHDGDDDGFYEDDDKGIALTLSLKHFPSNTFYIKPGIYHRNQTRVTSQSWSSDYGWYDNDSVVYQDVGINLAIGNQWQWENLTLGCDWIGVNKSVAILDQKYDESEDELSIADLDTFTVLNFYIGASF